MPVHVGAGQRLEGLRIGLTQTGSIEGRVTTADGRPIRGAASNASTAITTFGNFTTKAGSRELRASLRLTF
jgi:hypothetical protein